MKTKIISLLLISMLLFNGKLKADSPLTSTNIAQAYKDLPIVTSAKKSKGNISNELMDFLHNKSNPIAEKMAVINAISWNMAGQKNASQYIDYVLEKDGYKSTAILQKKGNADDLLCIAYLKALDNYFYVPDALAWAKKARSKNPKSYTFNIITALIEAQHTMDLNWCKVYQIGDAVRAKKGLNMDIKQAAIDNIYEYLDSYQSHCKE